MATEPEVRRDSFNDPWRLAALSVASAGVVMLVVGATMDTAPKAEAAKQAEQAARITFYRQRIKPRQPGCVACILKPYRDPAAFAGCKA